MQSAGTSLWHSIRRHRFTILLAALLLLILLAPIAQELSVRGHADWVAPVPNLLFALVLIAAIPTVGRRPRILLLAVVLAMPAVVLRLTGWLFPSLAGEVAHLATSSAFLGFVIARILRHLFSQRIVTFNTISEAFCLYLLLGFLWALLYELALVLDPAALFVPARAGEIEVHRIARFVELMYFSFTTLTTLGYGDIVPRAALARMLAVLEAIAGQAILVVLIARLVGLHVSQVATDDDSAPD